MRSGLQPVAILSNKDSYHDRFAPPVDTRARSENASAVSNMAQEAVQYKKTNVVELAFHEVPVPQILDREYPCCMSEEQRILRVGVLGAGQISQAAHFDACRKANNAELYAICDVAED